VSTAGRPEPTARSGAPEREPEPATHPSALARLAAGPALALGFLTILPAPAVDPGPRGVGRAAAWFPLVGALLGAAAGGVRAGGQPLLGALPASALAVAALVALTGALHQDGLADTADGLGARGGRERRLAVMRDSAIGAYGVLALVGWTLLLTSALAQLSAADALLTLIAAAAAARWAALLHALAAPPARRDGLGAGFEVTALPFALASVLTTGVALLAAGPLGGLAAIASAAATAALTTTFARRTLGGRTGDTLGATVALAELAVCLTLTAVWR
jgi:adenosylcobinamide-GDP ribazoletransferase